MLPELQKNFLEGVYARRGQVPVITDIISDDGPVSPEEQFAIYRDSIFGGLTKSLESIYPLCKQLVGDEFFDAMMQRYIQQTPSKTADLNQYGNSLAAFIEDFQPAQSLPYLADVARMEWTWHRAYWSADHTPLAASDLAAIHETDREHIVLHLPPSAGLLASPWPLLRIREVAEEDGEPVSLDEGGVRVMIWREALETRMELLDEAEWLFLSMAKDGSPLGMICEQLNNWHTEVPLESLFSKALSHGWLAGYELPDNPSW